MKSLLRFLDPKCPNELEYARPVAALTWPAFPYSDFLMRGGGAPQSL
jgi:hypothetical protein